MSAAKRYETVYKFKILDFKTINGGELKQIFLSLSKSNSLKRQSLCSFPKRNKVWKQKLRIYIDLNRVSGMI